MPHHRSKKSRHIHSLILLAVSLFLILVGASALWVATLKIPDLSSFENRKIAESTKIYDRTGQVLLYDTGSNAKRSVVSLSEISPYIQKATIAIEDSNFYRNIGIEPTSIMRAVLTDIISGGFDQGASTITQQVVKNSLLTTDKTVTRKIKELVLSIKLTRMMSKDQILEAYLNETSYGGTKYGVEEASQEFFGKPAKDVTLAEAAYIAAIPQAPTHYSPYGQHKADLDARQKTVLGRMKELNMISDAEYKSALAEKVDFLPGGAAGIRAPHFVMFVIDYLTKKYGEEMVDNGGLRVTTSLDFDMQEKAEAVVTKFAPGLANNFNAGNAAVVAVDPTTGDILTMVGSKDYFDDSIDGQYNDTLSSRQPGSTFKPFVYATLFEKGYTPETILFDTQTEFSQYCTPDGKPKNPGATVASSTACYMPGEYDDKFEGPLTIRQALAQSRNIPAVKALYLAGIPQSIETARSMGITTLSDPNRYGLTLVLGGGEVSLLDMASAYGVFANDGMRNPYRYVLEVDDSGGNILEKVGTPSPTKVLPADIARQISSILSDTNVRMDSLKPIGESIGRQVAIKTGTTNDYRDVWTIGYTPNLVVAAWAGNNDNKPMKHNVAGLIITPLWGAFMSQVAKNFPPATFGPPPAPLTDGKPVLRGIWQGGQSYWVDTVSGKVATQYTPQETRKEIVFPNVHSILYWVNKDDPRGPPPADPKQDPQYDYWEYGVQKWLSDWKVTNPTFKETTNFTVPTAVDNIHTAATQFKVSFSSPAPDVVVDPNQLLPVSLQSIGPYPAMKTDVYVNGKYAFTNSTSPLSFTFAPNDIGVVGGRNVLAVTVYDNVYNHGQATTTFMVSGGQ